MRPIATDVAWSLCVSASLSVGRNREPHENGSTDRDGISGVDSGGIKEPCITSGSDSLGKGQLWECVCRHISKYKENPE